MPKAGFRQAVVLSGGGAYAAYEVGVLKALAESAGAATADQPFDPAIVTGTSAGAFNAALFLSGEAGSVADGVSYLEQTWRDQVSTPAPAGGGGVLRYRGLELLPVSIGRGLNLAGRVGELYDDSKFFASDWLRRGVAFWQEGGGVEPKLMEMLDLGSAIDSSPMHELVDETVDLPRVRASRRALRIAVTNWRTGKLRVFANRDMSDAIGHAVVLASAAMPMAFAPIVIEGDPYVDGGVVMQTPLKPAIDAGADLVHLVIMDPSAERIPLPRLSSTMDSVYRMMVSSQSATVVRDLETARRVNAKVARGTAREGQRALTVHIHHPRQSLGPLTGMLNFGQNQVTELIAQGYRDVADHACADNGCILP